MSRAAQCPGCGAPITFAWSSAVQTACPYCRAIIVRHDVDLEKVGEVADLPPDASPLQIGAAGHYDGKSFHVIGRIRYEWEQGTWNEWHIMLNDGRTGWLSDAQAEYAISFPAPPKIKIGNVKPQQLKPGNTFLWEGSAYVVTVSTKAAYVGFEGELPFRTTDREMCTFVDLRTEDARFATADFSEDPPLLFLGRLVTFGELGLTGLREFEGWERPA